MCKFIIYVIIYIIILDTKVSEGTISTILDVQSSGELRERNIGNSDKGWVHQADCIT